MANPQKALHVQRSYLFRSAHGIRMRLVEVSSWASRLNPEPSEDIRQKAFVRSYIPQGGKEILKMELAREI